MNETVKYSKENATLSLQKMITGWLAENGTRNVSSLARGSGVSEACVRRIMTNNSLPTTINLHKLITFINGEGTHQQILSSLSDDLQKHLTFELSYLQFEEVQKYYTMDQKEKLLPDFAHQVIFERSSMGSGISLEEVKELFGAYGETVINSLIKSELVQNKDGQLVALEKYKNHSWSTEFAIHFLSDSIKTFYKTDCKVNYLFNINESVSKTGYSKVMDILELAHKNISHIINENPGNVPLTMGGFMDTMTSKNFFEKENGAL